MFDIVIKKPLESIFMFSNYISDDFYKESDIYTCERIENEIASEISSITGIDKHVIKNIAQYTLGTMYSVGSCNNNSTTVAVSVTARLN